ncbi:hypothetical protein JCM16358_20980 [Halanaerocella petrolearia]
MKDIKVKEKVLLSLGRCSRENLPTDITKPKIRLAKSRLKDRLKENKLLISAFDDNIKKVAKFIDDDYLFLLTDFNGILLKVVTGKNIQQLVANSINKGVSFSEESSGTNAISLAMDLKEQIYLAPEHHYCDFLQDWYCFALPLYLNRDIIGYLDVSTIRFELKKELMGIALLLRDNIIKDLESHKKVVSLQQENSKRKVANKQIKVLKFLAQGLTEQEVARKISCSISTIKYHKKKIFDYLDACCTREAIIKALQKEIIDLTEL